MSAPNFPKSKDFKTDTRVQYIEETNSYVFTDPSDGLEYEFDSQKGAWFPMWNEALVEQQQSAYGTDAIDTETNDAGGSSTATRGKGQEASKRKLRENTRVYVSGLPLDTTEKEVADYFSQCGAIMPDLVTNKPRIKLYRDADGSLKGDALVTYFKAPSVQLAIDILDDSQFRSTDASRISVQEASFESKNDSVAAESEASKRPRIDPKLLQKRIAQMERKLDWADEERPVSDRYKRTVILKHMFTIEELQEDVTLLLDLAEDVRSECEKLGVVTSVKIFDLSEEGAVAVKFKSEASAVACVKAMNGRFFGGRQIEATIYDGRKRYRSSKKSGDSAADPLHRDDGDGRAQAQGSSDRKGNGNDNGDGDGDDEEKRMEKYAQWLEDASN